MLMPEPVVTPVPGLEDVRSTARRLSRLSIAREGRLVSLLVVLVAGGAVLAALLTREPGAAALAIAALGASACGGCWRMPWVRASALQLALVAMGWAVHWPSASIPAFLASLILLPLIPIPSVVARAGFVGVIAHVALGLAQGIGGTGAFVLLAIGAAATVAVSYWARHRERWIFRRVQRHRARRASAAATQDELQRARQLERRLLETATNLRDTQDQLEHDVRRRQAMADQLSVAMAKAQEANRAKSTFLARMSHELRTPLNSVIGFSSLVRRNAAERLKPNELQYLDRINANGAHLLSLLSDILDISRIEAGRMPVELSVVPILPLLREVMDIVRPPGTAAAEAVRLQLVATDEDHVVEADPSRLRQVLINLVGNALKFTEQGSVTVTLRLTEHGVPERVEVTDTGVGIPPDRHRAIFEPFEQADNSTARRFGGTGLGLAISRQLCTLMGMTLTLQSTPGEGSTFAVHFGPSVMDARRPTDARPTLQPVSP